MSNSHPLLDALSAFNRTGRAWEYECLQREARSIVEQLRSREDAMREVYELLYLGEADNALHGLDAYMIREGILRGEAASSPASGSES